MIKKPFSKLVGLVVAMVFLFSLAVKTSWAQPEFLTDYTVDYTVRDTGTTKTKFSISLTNQLSNVYATEFSLSIGSTKLENIRIYDRSGSLEPRVVQGNKTTNITIPFSDKLLGKDKTRHFYLEFDSLDFANQLGSVWEISIPKLSKTEDLTSYQLSLAIPASFGQPASITPSPISHAQKQGFIVYQFSQSDLIAKGISATFGEKQEFNFHLDYHLNNNNVYPVTTEIALPPDTAFQKIILQTLKPKPENIIVDRDGNWLANYLLSPKQNLNVVATGSAEIFLDPRSDFPRKAIDYLEEYLKEQKYWETSNQRIQQLAEQLGTSQEIYSYVVNNLIYDYGRLGEETTRFGAANALDNQDSAICMEFTDLFVALSRAAQIPTRAVNGYAYTTNSALRPLSLKKDVLHAWPEYFDQNQNLWIPVDPTWGNTTGGIDFFNQTDLNHFTFAILGLDSNYPVPAGAYKTELNQGKDIDVKFGKSFASNPQTEIEINLPDKVVAGIPLKGEVVLKNIGNVAVYNQTIQFSSTSYPLDETIWQLPSLPPFSSVTITLELPATNWTDKFTDRIQVTSDLSTANHLLTVEPAYQFLFFNQTVFKFLGGLFSLMVFGLVFKFKSRSKFRSQPKSRPGLK